MENSQGDKVFLEVKNVSYKNEDTDELAQFPDAITARGLKHLQDLVKIKQLGHRAIIFYLVQRQDCQKFSIARHIDSSYYQGFLEAIDEGVEVFVYRATVDPHEISLEKELPWSR